MESLLPQVFFFIIFIYSVIAHEVAHGTMAEYLGDPTARLAGRITLNPLPHLDPIGSVLLPALLWLSHSPILFGWAKPVPYNPYNLSNQRYGNALVAGAGIATNLFLAAFFGLLIRFGVVTNPLLASFFTQIAYLNIMLGIFNLVPIPPLDGSKIVFDFLPDSQVTRFFEQYGFAILIFFLLFGFDFLIPIVQAIFTFLTGITS